MTLSTNTLKSLARKEELLQIHSEEFLQSRGWSQIMLGWYWVWNKKITLDCAHKQTGEDKKDWEFNCRSTNEAMGIEKALYELTECGYVETEVK